MNTRTVPLSGVGHTPVGPELAEALQRFVRWLESYGEISCDHQSFFAGPIGGRAKALYYRNKLLGTAAVAPMIFCEAFVPSARKLFFRPVRFPIADAHYAMGFAYLYEAWGDQSHLARAENFLRALQESRCAGYREFAWGYPFDWVTRNGVIKAQTPLITTTPYVYEAFQAVYRLTGRVEWKGILESVVRHAREDFKDFATSATACTCSYTPFDQGGVINAAAYRAFMLTSAAKTLGGDQAIQTTAIKNLNFVLENQNPDGSWPYAVDGVRGFVDHFHTCFVMKALAKIHTLTGNEASLSALRRGVDYYLANLFDVDGLPKPFSRAPRMTVYKRELYDCAECINLCLLLQDRFPALQEKLETVVRGVLSDWVKSDGSFRARQLKFGWDNVPMHRWAQSQIFRSLAFYILRTQSAAPTPLKE